MKQSISDIQQKLGLSDEEVAKPLPKPTQWSQPFWEAAREHRSGAPALRCVRHVPASAVSLV